MSNETKQSARELLVEAKKILAEAKDNTRFYDGYYADAILDDAAAYQNVITKIDIYLAAPSESAMEIVRKIREGGLWLEPRGGIGSGAITDTEAAAEIEGLQRRVPRAMLEDLLDMCFDLGDEYFLKGGKEYAEQAVARILAKHGVEVD